MSENKQLPRGRHAWRPGDGMSLPSTRSRSFIGTTMLLVVAFVAALIGVGAYQLAGPVAPAQAVPAGSEYPTTWTVNGNVATGTTTSGIVVTATVTGPAAFVSPSTGSLVFTGPTPSYLPATTTQALRLNETNCTNTAPSGCGSITYAFSSPVTTPVLYTGDRGAQTNNGAIYTSFRDTPTTLVSGGTFSLDAPGSSTSNMSVQNGGATIGFTDPASQVGQPVSATSSCGQFGCGVYDLNLPTPSTSSITLGLGYAGTGTQADLFSLILGVTPAPQTLDCTASMYQIGANDNHVVSSVPLSALGSSGSVTATAVFSIPANVSAANGLGVSANGTQAFFVGTVGTTARLYTYTAATGALTSIALPSTVTGFVAGAVNPLNGLYYFGGVQAGSDLYAYNPGTGTVVQVGRSPAVAASDGGNGDIAFSATGDLFIISQNLLVSVAANNVPSAAGTAQLAGTRISSGTFAVGNGIAFDAQGFVYVQSNASGSSVIQKVNPVSGQVVGTSTTSSLLSTDLATCATPPTLSLQKNVVGRANAGDQFNLNITSGPATLTSTTTGSAVGLQNVFTGPTVGLPGTNYILSEAAAGTTQLAQYSSTYQCLDTTHGNALVSSGTGTSFTLSYPPSTSQAIVCTFTNTPNISAYTVAKTASTTSVIPGQTITYTVTVNNTGFVPYTNANPASFTDNLANVLDDASYNGDASNGAVVTGSTLSWSGPLPVGGTATITYSVTVKDPDPGNHVLTNAVVPTGPGGGCATGEGCETTTPVGSFTYQKSASRSTALPGDVVTYTVTVHNTGQIAYTADDPASISDDLSAVLDDAAYNGDASNGATVTGTTLDWSGALPINGTVTITYSVTVDDPDAGDHLLTNTVSSDTPGGSCVADGDCTTTTPVSSYTVAKTASTTTAQQGGTVSYTVTVRNTGQVAYTAAKPASFADDLSAVLDDAAYNGDADNGATVTGNTLSWSGPLAVGGTVQVTYSVTVDDPDAGDHVLTNAVVPTGPGGGCTTPGDCTTTTPVGSIHVTKTTTATTVDPGETVPYTIEITNTGQVAYTADDPASISDDISDVLDDAAYNGDLVSSTGDGASYAAPVISWSGPLGIGDTVTLTYSVTVADPDAGDHHLLNSVVTPPGLGNCPADSDDPDCTAEVPARSFTVAKTSSTTSVVPGGTVTYTVTVTNTGAVGYTAADPASFTDDLSRVLDDAGYNGDADNGATVTGDTLSWAGALPVDGSVTITYSVTVDDPDTGDHELTNTVRPTAPGGGCPEPGDCTTTTPVASYTIAKAASAATAMPGDTIVYTVTVTNTGAVPYTAADPASFTDDLSAVLDDAAYNGDATEGATVSDGTLSWSGALAVDGTVIVTYSVTVDDPDTGDRVLTNAVVPTGPGGDCPEPGDCTTTTPVASYTVAKAASVGSAAPGDVVTYTVTVTNTGDVDYSAATPASFDDDLSAVLDDATYNGDATNGATVTDTTLIWSGALPAHGSVTITYSVTVNDPDTGDQTLSNAVAPTAPGGDCTAPGDCTTTTPVASYTVAKSASAATAQPGEVISYTVTVTNTSGAAYTAAKPASFTDDLSAVLDDAAYNGDASDGATVTGSTLAWSGALPARGTVTVTYSVTVNDPDTGDRVLTNAVVPTGPGGDCTTPGGCTTTTPVASYTVAKSASTTTATPGSVITYTVVVSNTGEVAYTAAKPASFTDDLSKVLDDATYNGDADNGATVTGDTLSWSGALPAAGTVTITYSVTVNEPDTGDHVLSNAVVPTGPGGDCTTFGGCTTTTPVASYTVAKSASAVTALPGGTVDYTVVVSNTGEVAYTDESPASFTDDLSAVLDDAAYNGDASNGATVTGDVLSWTGALPVGGTVQVTYSVTVDDPDAGDHVLTNAVVPTGPGGDCTTPGGCTTTTPVASYTVAKAASATSALPGGIVTYTVTVVNTGEVAYTAANPATFTDDLSAVLDDATYNGDASNGATVTGSTLSWSGALPVAADATITYSVTVDDPDAGDHVLSNAVVPTAPGGDCTAPGDCTTTTPVGSLHVVKTTTATDVTPGETVPYTITLTNTGQTAYTDAHPASFTDDLSEVLDDAAYNGDAASSTGDGVRYTAPVISWSGPLGIGETVTVTYSVTVNTPDSGDHRLANAVVTPPTEGGNCPPDSTDPDCVANVPAGSFTVAKTASTTSALPGDTVGYAITVKNTGTVAYTAEHPASFTDDLSRVLDDAGYNGDATNGATVTGTKLSWSGALPVDGTVVVSYSVTVRTPDAGDHRLANAVRPTAPGGGCDPDGRCTTDTPVAGYTVAKSVDAMVARHGQKVTYTITVTNTGGLAYTGAHPASFTDDLAKVLDDAVYNGDATDGATVSGHTLSWSGPLEVGATAQIRYSVTVGASAGGDHELANAVTPTDPSGACAAPGECVTSTPVLGYTVHKTASAETASPGQRITYRITVTNTGDAAYTAENPASFTDDLSDALKLADYNEDADRGAAYNAPVLSWAGALPVGRSLTVSYTMTVKADAVGRITNVVVTPPGSGADCAAGSDDPDCTAVTTVTPPPLGAAVHTGGYLTGTGIPVWMLIGLGWIVLIGACAIGFLIHRRRSSES